MAQTRGALIRRSAAPSPAAAGEGRSSSLRAQSIDVDALINNAGYGLAGAFVETDLTTELEMIQVNVVALTQLTKLLLPAMVARKSGAISEAIADELRDTGVTVTALCPGPTETGFAAVADMTSSRLFNMSKPMTSAAVARVGYRGMKSCRRVVVAGMKNKLLAESIRITPRRLVTTIVRKMQERS